MWVIGCGTCLKSTTAPLGPFILLLYLICKSTTLSSLQRASLPLSPAYNVRSRGTKPNNNHLSFLYCKIIEESCVPLLSFLSYFYLPFTIVERYTFVHPVCIIGCHRLKFLLNRHFPSSYALILSTYTLSCVSYVLLCLFSWSLIPLTWTCNWKSSGQRFHVENEGKMEIKSLLSYSTLSIFLPCHLE